MADTRESINHSDISAALKAVIDPEVGINIVDLGLIYQIEVDQRRIVVIMTMTTPSCPMAPMLVGEVEDVLAALAPNHSREVQLVWDPPWSPSQMSAEAKQTLGWDSHNE